MKNEVFQTRFYVGLFACVVMVLFSQVSYAQKLKLGSFRTAVYSPEHIHKRILSGQFVPEVHVTCGAVLGGRAKMTSPFIKNFQGKLIGEFTTPTVENMGGPLYASVFETDTDTYKGTGIESWFGHFFVRSNSNPLLAAKPHVHSVRADHIESAADLTDRVVNVLFIYINSYSLGLNFIDPDGGDGIAYLRSRYKHPEDRIDYQIGIKVENVKAVGGDLTFPYVVNESLYINPIEALDAFDYNNKYSDIESFRLGDISFTEALGIYPDFGKIIIEAKVEIINAELQTSRLLKTVRVSTNNLNDIPKTVPEIFRNIRL